MFFDEFCSFLEGFVLAPGALLVTVDFDFHMDEPDDYAVRRFFKYFNCLI